MLPTNHKSQQNIRYNWENAAKSKAAPIDQDLISRMISLLATDQKLLSEMLSHLLLKQKTIKSVKQIPINRGSDVGFGTDHKLDQVDFTARMSFLSANQRESTLSNQTPLSANTWSLLTTLET